MESDRAAYPSAGPATKNVEVVPQRPLAAIYVTHHGDPRPGDSYISRPLILAIWRNGCVIWSDDGIRGGPPYLEGRGDPARMFHLLDEMENRGIFRDTRLDRQWVGPDAAFTTIMIDDGRRRLKMVSWHELFEQKPRLVATAHGVTLLDGRSREEVLAEQPAEYRAFRQAWTDVRSALAGLIPESGRPVGALDWRPQ